MNHAEIGDRVRVKRVGQISTPRGKRPWTRRRAGDVIGPWTLVRRSGTSWLCRCRCGALAKHSPLQLEQSLAAGTLRGCNKCSGKSQIRERRCGDCGTTSPARFRRRRGNKGCCMACEKRRERRAVPK